MADPGLRVDAVVAGSLALCFIVRDLGVMSTQLALTRESHVLLKLHVATGKSVQVCSSPGLYGRHYCSPS